MSNTPTLPLLAVCIWEGAGNWIQHGKTYQVIGSNGGKYLLEGIEHSFDPGRFRILTPPFQVVCVRAYNPLKPGKTYTVNNITFPQRTYTLQELDQRWSWSWDRFQIAGLLGSESSATAVVAATTLDLSDWKVWRDHNLPAGECVCRIPREQCTYHKRS